jgi:hypothetical protein
MIEGIHDDWNFRLGGPLKRFAERQMAAPHNWRRL